MVKVQASVRSYPWVAETISQSPPTGSTSITSTSSSLWFRRSTLRLEARVRAVRRQSGVQIQ